MNQQEAAGPAEDRIDLVDALRGLALLGILLANITVFSGWVFLSDEGRAALAGSEVASAQSALHRLVVDGKFYTLFSLLFGAGFALQLERLTRRGADGVRILRRRMLILLAIGLVHQWVIWDGDILVLYALLGLLLPAFRTLSDRALLAWGAVLIFAVPLAGVALVQAMGWAPDAGLMGLSDRIAKAIADVDPSQTIEWVRREDLRARLAWLASGPLFAWAFKLMSWRIPKVLGIMLLGLWIGRRLAAGTLVGDRRLLRRVLVTGGIVGIPLSVLYALQQDASQSGWQSLLGTVPLALGYAAGFVLVWPRAKAMLGVLAWPGRMALTNYLMQSVICVITFYGLGLGFAGYWPPAGFYAFAIAVFAAQTMFSRWWLQRHAQGPMEALWRRWTYPARRPLTGPAATV